ncbi:hypothetical protein PXH69_24355 [Rhodococcus qingshengii]|uniref:Uncharacterized protein n=1 Tax=Rhodococcus qingshengii TaxID=334542 RepID=A0AAW6LQP0_RHOSG|nr:hypothetical protein [Rhodococcus qingshengii]MDE8648103.1 hypothetical protein [Rhodococcus qingshengii]
MTVTATQPVNETVGAGLFRASLNQVESGIYEEKHNLAMGYAWGRQDMGCGENNSLAAFHFADEYAKQGVRYHREERHMFTNPRTAYEAYFAGQEF